jgi:hypothetical protein
VSSQSPYARECCSRLSWLSQHLVITVDRRRGFLRSASHSLRGSLVRPAAVFDRGPRGALTRSVHQGTASSAGRDSLLAGLYLNTTGHTPPSKPPWDTDPGNIGMYLNDICVD